MSSYKPDPRQSVRHAISDEDLERLTAAMQVHLSAQIQKIRAANRERYVVSGAIVLIALLAIGLIVWGVSCATGPYSNF